MFSNGIDKYICETIIPPLPIKKNIYRCSKEFCVEPIISLYEDKHINGLIVVDGTTTKFYKITGECIDVSLLGKFSVLRDKKQKCGGQSAPRFQRKRLNQIHGYVLSIVEKMEQYYNPLNTTYDNLVIVGTGDVKDQICSCAKLNTTIKEKITATIAIADTSDMSKILDTVRDLFLSDELLTDKNVLDSFFNKVDADSDTIIYGLNETYESLKNGMLSEIILHKDAIDDLKLTDISQYAKDLGCKVIIIDSRTSIGKRFLDGFGGVSGILWFKL